MGRRAWVVVVPVLLLASLAGPVAAAPPPGGTPVCGTALPGIMTWNGAGSPYVICNDGFRVYEGSTVVIDGAGGPVEVQAAGDQSRLIIDGGALRTENTSAADQADFSRQQDDDEQTEAWGGVLVQNGGELALRHARMRHGPIRSDGEGSTLSLADSFMESYEIRIGDRSTASLANLTTTGPVRPVGAKSLTITGGVFSSPSSIYGDMDGDALIQGVSLPNGGAIDITGWSPSTVTVQDSVLRSGRIAVRGSGHGGDSVRAIIARNMVYSESPPSDEMPVFPAIHLDRVTTVLGPGGTTGNHGFNNVLDAISIEGEVENSFVWRTPRQSSADAPFGYIGGPTGVVLRKGVVMTVPARGIVKGGTFRVIGGAIDATAGGVVWTGTWDNSVGPRTCGVNEMCQARPDRAGDPWPWRISVRGDIDGISLGTVAFTGAMLRRGLIEFSDAGEQWSSAPNQSKLTLASTRLEDVPIKVTGGEATVDAGVHIDSEIEAASTAVTVRDTEFLRHRQPIGWDDTFAVDATSLDQPVRLERNTVRGLARGMTIQAPWPYDVLTGNVAVRDNHFVDVTNPVHLSQVRARFGPSADIGGNTAEGTGAKSISLTGEALGDFVWVSPSNGPLRRSLGYGLGPPASPGDASLLLRTGARLIVPKGGVVRSTPDIFASGGIGLLGGALDATAGGATFTSGADRDFALYDCADACEEHPAFGPIKAGTDPATGVPGTMRFKDVTLRGVLLTQAAGAPVLSIDGAEIHSGWTRVDGTDLHLRRADVRGNLRHWSATSPMDLIELRNSTGATIERSTVSGASGNGVTLTAAGASIDASRFTDNGHYSYAGVASPGWAVKGSDPAVHMTCSAVAGNAQGLSLHGGSSIHDSDLLDDLTAVTSLVDASGNWWGQPGGPVAGQVTSPANAATTPARTAPSPCAATAGFNETAPGPPASVSAAALSQGAMVSWAEGPSGSATVRRFVVTAAPGGATAVVDGGATSAYVGGLVNGTAYRFSVRAESIGGLGPASAVSAAVVPGTAPPPPPPPPRSGYWMAAANGAVYAFGDAAYAGAPNLNGTTVVAEDIEANPAGSGYWIVDSLGNVYAHGGAPNLGGVRPGTLLAGERATGLSAKPSGDGYWVFTSLGRALPFGSAGFFKDMFGTPLNGPVLDAIATPSGLGYYMVGSDGGVFAFGDAVFRGSMGGTPLNGPVVGLAPDPDNDGYWLVGSDGGTFAFSAPFRGSMGGKRLNKPVVGMVAFGTGYLLVGADGGIFNFSVKPFHGSLGSSPPAFPITSVAALD
jgi:hypothetical protein